MMVYSEENITKLRIKEFIDYLDLKVRKFIDSCDEIGEGDEWIFSAQETIINLDEFKENFDKDSFSSFFNSYKNLLQIAYKEFPNPWKRTAWTRLRHMDEITDNFNSIYKRLNAKPAETKEKGSNLPEDMGGTKVRKRPNNGQGDSRDDDEFRSSGYQEDDNNEWLNRYDGHQGGW